MTLADKINTMIEKTVSGMLITSAGGDSPKTNRVIALGDRDNPNLEEEFFDNIGNSEKGEELDSSQKRLTEWEEGNVGDIAKLSSGQFSNIKGITTNPAGFVLGNLKTLAKGAGVAALALILLEVIEFAITELLKPGRAFDRRFKRIASREIEIFTERQEQEELRFGIKRVIVTTRPYLRGGQGQSSGNYALPPQSALGFEFYNRRVPLQGIGPRPQGGRQKAGSVFRNR